MIQHAKQGHKYALAGCERDVLALEYGRTVEVAEIDLDAPWPLVRKHVVHASQLTPLPMHYHGGKIPGDN